MKYYKKLGVTSKFTIKGKVYPENYKKECSSTVSFLADRYPSDWQEVLAGDYFVQENKLPECFRVKMIKHPLREKYVEWWKNEFNSEFYYEGDLGRFYGFDSYDRTNVSNAAIDNNIPENAIELTLEQWDKIINKNTMEEKEIIGYKLKEDCKHYRQVAEIISGFTNPTDSEKFFTDYFKNEILLDGAYIYNLKQAGVLDLWFDPIYNKEIPDIKIGDYIYMIDACGANKEYFSKYSGDVLKVTSFKKENVLLCPNAYWLRHTPGSFSGGGFRVDKSAWEYGVHFRKATTEEILKHLQVEFTKITGIDVGSNVQETSKMGIISYGEVEKFFLHVKGEGTGDYSTHTHNWFDDNPNEKYQLGIRLKGHGVMSPNCTLSKPKLTFGGYDVIFEKVTSGVRITCAGETGTLSQMEQIFNFITTFPTFKFGSQRLEKIEFPSVNVHLDDLTEKPLNIKIGCTTGSFEDFIKILEYGKNL